MSELDATPESERREGRGRLSSIDMLPEECDEDIAWANTELRERKMPQTEILKQFNARLADKGQKGVSKGAFSRYSVRMAIEVRKIEASRAITSTVLSRLAPGDRSDSMIGAVELLKHRIIELVMGDEEPDPKALGQATLALQRLSSTLARTSELQRRDRQEQREEQEREALAAERAKAETEAADAATKIATEAGLSEDRVRAIRRGVLGLAV
ncbi:MAG: DUF3486 family protein [Sphingomonadales bacterium]|nr:DUF3486 family protein [Sphingomonadales bacterium]MDE2171341.1 DUF3486 family protein [Sphingomonadales bacterium]